MLYHFTHTEAWEVSDSESGSEYSTNRRYLSSKNLLHRPVHQLNSSSGATYRPFNSTLIATVDESLDKMAKETSVLESQSNLNTITIRAISELKCNKRTKYAMIFGPNGIIGTSDDSY